MNDESETSANIYAHENVSLYACEIYARSYSIKRVRVYVRVSSERCTSENDLHPVFWRDSNDERGNQDVTDICEAIYVYMYLSVSQSLPTVHSMLVKTISK